MLRLEYSGRNMQNDNTMAANALVPCIIGPSTKLYWLIYCVVIPGIILINYYVNMHNVSETVELVRCLIPIGSGIFWHV